MFYPRTELNILKTFALGQKIFASPVFLQLHTSLSYWYSMAIAACLVISTSSLLKLIIPQPPV